MLLFHQVVFKSKNNLKTIKCDFPPQKLAIFVQPCEHETKFRILDIGLLTCDGLTKEIGVHLSLLPILGFPKDCRFLKSIAERSFGQVHWTWTWWGLCDVNFLREWVMLKAISSGIRVHVHVHLAFEARIASSHLQKLSRNAGRRGHWLTWGAGDSTGDSHEILILMQMGASMCESSINKNMGSDYSVKRRWTQFARGIPNEPIIILQAKRLPCLHGMVGNLCFFPHVDGCERRRH